MKKLFAVIILSTIFVPLVLAAGAVKLYERDEVIPTYLSGPPDPNPMFYFGRESQGAEGRIYPYPLYDNLTNQRGEKTYHIVYLENDFVKIGIAPEIGGRLLSALDKTTGYDFIYRQHVIKPALIGLIGAWMSGGIEWNIPHHHRATTFLPVQWRTEENADGSKTIWVGELEIRDRMSWAVGYTLHPGSSVLTCQVRILNRTPLAHTMLCFANVAVHANENYQIIFPPGTQWVTYHAKREFASWPIAHSRYSGADFRAGVDVSWWKNHVVANSMFAWNYTDDFFGGYDHGRQAGIVCFADHRIVPGKKFWTWGSGPRGRMWDEILTDTDGPYIELMSGAYSDNQPDYSWLAPFETRAFEMHWYPVRDIGGFKNANLDAAVNLVVTNGAADFGFYATKPHRSAVARLTVAGQIVSEEKISIGPAKPYRKQIALPAGASEFDVRASLSVAGRELIAYAPVRLDPQPQPAAVTNIPAPGEIQNDEELFLTGQRVDQFHDPRRDGEPYWQELLRRDPGHTAAHTSLGILDLRRARFADAEQHFRKALERLTARYTTPKNAEPLYYLGVALAAQGKPDEAFDAFSKAAWSQEWKSPAYFSLAQIAASRGDFAAALDFANQSLDANALNVRAYRLKAAALRHLGRNSGAKDVVVLAMRKTNPLDPGLMVEQWLLARGTLNLPTAAQEEVAAEFFDAGLWRDGLDALGQFKGSPLLHYYLGHFAEQLGDASKAKEYRQLAAQQPPDYAFPFQWEMIPVLRRAMQADPLDARAPYYLGNLLFDWQPAEAVALWEKSVALDPNFSIAWRNLAQACAHKSDDESRAKAIGYLEKAVALPDATPAQFAELDQLYEAAGAPVEKRLASLERCQIHKDESLARLIGLKTLAGQADEAIALLKSRTFNVWEGGASYNTGELWANAHLARGRQRFEARDYRAALADFETALKPPPNLRAQERRGAARREAEITSWIERARAALGELPVKFTFTNSAEQTLPLRDLPTDWSPYEFLVLEFKASSSQRFDLGLVTPQGRHAKRIGPFAGVWVRAAIPLRFYREPAGSAHDLAATYNQPRNSYWINIHSGSFGPLTNVTGFSVSMEHPVGAPTLEIRSVALATNDPGDAVLEGKPLVDEFGQYTRADWPGKARSLEDLKKRWAAEDAELPATATNRCPYGGFLGAQAKATGFFRVEPVDGRWWFVCPDGHLFYSTGVNGVGTFAGTRVQGREDLFAALPPTNLVTGARGRGAAGSFYTWNLQRRFGDEWRAKWAEFTTRRLMAWGFNTMHNWGVPDRSRPEPRVPYAAMLRGWQTGNSIMGLPDVYAEDFARRVDEAAANQLEPLKDDPYMLGYFIGNEPPWPGRESLLCDMILQGQPSEIQNRLKTFLADGDTPARRKEFVLAAFQVYLDTINAAVRRHAPNHLNLGIRFGGDPPEDVLKAARGFDVFSVNIYRYAPSRATLDRIYSIAQRPILIGEFHIGAPERGLSPGLVQAMNQDERAAGYRYYVEQCAAHPALVGTHWFQWLDQPVTGRFDGENYNIGFVDVTDQPYRELVAAATLTHQRLFDIHSGKIPPTDRRAKASELGNLAPRPLYRDPVFDAPTDPALCFNAEQGKWFMYYTARRGTATNAPGVSWVHGSDIGIAESSDGGATWTYRGTADIRYGKDAHPNDSTYWAPEVIWADGAYHMFLTFVPGIFEDWNHPREIVHLTSSDGVKWDAIGPLDLKSDRVIDACVLQLPNGTWRLWYKDERKPKPLSFADSPDLKHWEPKGTAVTEFSGEGPKVFRWKNKYWLVADCWSNGMRVWSSEDCANWKLQDEALFGNHGDVVVSGDRAWWFYFNGPHAPRRSRTTAINVVELSVADGRLLPGDPDRPTYIDLKPVREDER